jgi:hypothetical protein
MSLSLICGGRGNFGDPPPPGLRMFNVQSQFRNVITSIEDTRLFTTLLILKVIKHLHLGELSKNIEDTRFFTTLLTIC